MRSLPGRDVQVSGQRQPAAAHLARDLERGDRSQAVAKEHDGPVGESLDRGQQRAGERTHVTIGRLAEPSLAARQLGHPQGDAGR